MKERKEYYKEILITQYNYPDYIAEKTAIDFENMDDDCREYFERYMNVKKPEYDLFYKEYSVKMLMEKYQMLFPAAVIFIFNLKQDYKKYSDLLSLGIK